MSRKANPAVIGAFVVGALVIAVLAVLLLASGTLFKKKLDFVMHFHGSVKGLTVGAPLSYRGVQVGSVKKIEIVVSPDQNARIPVTVEVDPTAFTFSGFEQHLSLHEFRQAIHDSAVSEGLRAQLQMQSLLTGQLFIQLDYFPNTKPRFADKEGEPEIPTVPTTLHQLGTRLQQFPIEKVLGDLEKTATALAELAASHKIGATLDAVRQAFDDVSRLTTALDSRTRELGPTLVEARQALAEGRAALAQSTETLAAAQQTFTQATRTLRPIEGLVGDDSELLQSVEDALMSVTEAAHALGALAETLQRRPEAILRGKGPMGGH